MNIQKMLVYAEEQVAHLDASLAPMMRGQEVMGDRHTEVLLLLAAWMKASDSLKALVVLGSRLQKLRVEKSPRN